MQEAKLNILRRRRRRLYKKKIRALKLKRKKYNGNTQRRKHRKFKTINKKIVRGRRRLRKRFRRTARVPINKKIVRVRRRLRKILRRSATVRIPINSERSALPIQYNEEPIDSERSALPTKYNEELFKMGNQKSSESVPISDHYRRHYWSLFLDFIDAFKSVSYKGIPLPLLSIFQSYMGVDNKIPRDMSDPSFERFLNNKILTEEQIQPEFDRTMNSIKHPDGFGQRSGKTLISLGGVLRFPPHNILEYFDTSRTLFVTSDKVQFKDYLGIPVHRLDDYQTDVNKLDATLITKAKEIFYSCRNHPVFGNPHFQKKFIEEIPVMVQILAATDNYLDRVPVSCVIVGTTGLLIDRIVTIVAATKGVPSICMQHGVILGESSYMPVFATKVSVYGIYEKLWYEKMGVSERSIEIIGHPRFDPIFTHTNMPKTVFQQKIGVDPQKKTVLIATQHDNFWPHFIELLAKDSSFEIIHRSHPLESAERLQSYKQISSKYKSVKLSWGNVSLYDLLANVDAVIVSQSTVGLEGMLFGKPVLFLNSIGDFYSKEKLDCFFQNDQLELIKNLNHLMYDDSMQKYAENIRKQFVSYAYPQQLSGIKLAKLIYMLTGSMSYNPTTISDGTLIKGSGPAVYLIQKGMKRHIISEDVFKQSGFNWNNVRLVDDNILQKIPHGTLINSKTSI